MTHRVSYAARRTWWRKFHPLVRVGWYVSTAGKTRPMTQTAAGMGMIVAGLLLRRSQKIKNTPIYVHKVSPGKTTRIRVYRGTSDASEVTVRT